MLKFLLFTIYSFYYRDGERAQGTAFISAVFLFDFFIFLNIVALAGVFHISIERIVPWTDLDPTPLKYAKAMFLFILPAFVLTLVLFKQDKIVNMEYSDDQKSRGKIAVIIYGILSLIAAILLAKP